jgi:hypothetical protein
MAGIEIADGGVHPGSKAAVSHLVGQGCAGAVATSALEYMGAVFGLKGLDFGNLKDLMSKRFGWFFVYGTIKGKIALFTVVGVEFMDGVHLFDWQQFPGLARMAWLTAWFSPGRLAFLPFHLRSVGGWRFGGIGGIEVSGGEFRSDDSILLIEFQELLNGGLLSGVVEALCFPSIHSTTSV